eukprot:TRINITY_DN8297_c0_g1_i1.p1 TRINITY_DN8297_c0_g1~~TRINITY_DN8297_c0_g1_i1.p1  ORF type:complete len:706 (+),score=266.79 TRINITY_DN8297_c0_g1_i1:49-2118(+)
MAEDDGGASRRITIQEGRLQATQLDSVGVISCPILREYVTECGDKTVYFSIRAPEIVPGGKPIERIFLITDAALYNIPQTAVDTGIFFDARYPLTNLTQVLVIDGDAAPVVQFNGFRVKQGEQTLFTLRFTDDRRKAEALLTLCHLFPDLPILKKKKIDGRFYDIPYIDSALASGTPSSRHPAHDPSHPTPPTTGNEARRQLRWSQELTAEQLQQQQQQQPPPQQQGEIPYLLDAVALHDRGGGPEATASAVPPPSLHRLAEADTQKVGGRVRATERLERARRSLAGGPVHDPHFELQKCRLRDLLFDHDLTNLQLRASLSLLEDEPPAAAAQSPAIQEGLSGLCSVRRRGAETPRSGGDIRSEYSFTSQEDLEAIRRRTLQQQDDERKREDDELQRRQIRATLASIDSRIEAQVRKESRAQEETGRRVRERRDKGDGKLRQLHQEMQALRRRQKMEESKLAKQRERECAVIAARIDAARMRSAQNRTITARAKATAPRAKAAFGRAAPRYRDPEPAEPDYTDLDLVGDEVYAEYTRWRQSGGLAHGDGSWSKEDSVRLEAGLKERLRSLEEWGEDSYVTRVRVMVGNVARERKMLACRSPPEPRRTRTAEPTSPEPFCLSKTNKTRFQGLPSSRMQEDLKQMRLVSQKRLQELRLQLLHAQADVAPSPPLSPRQMAQSRSQSPSPRAR